MIKDFSKYNRRYDFFRAFLPVKIAYKLTIWTM